MAKYKKLKLDANLLDLDVDSNFITSEQSADCRINFTLTGVVDGAFLEKLGEFLEDMTEGEYRRRRTKQRPHTCCGGSVPYWPTSGQGPDIKSGN